MNPHLRGARVHSKAWAYHVGILRADGDAVWDEKTFDVMDFALFTAQTHPDAPPRELDTLTDWYVWGWYVDDFVAHIYEQSCDLKAAKEYLARLPAFMPEDFSVAVPTPENPMERALCDLWPRTALSMSVAWRRRFVGHIAKMADAGLRDIFLSTLDEPRYLDLIEYVSARRITGGMMWSADLVEYSMGAELPLHVYDARPIRVINETFFDSVALRNDIISYPRDEHEGKINNGVMVMREFLGCDLQRAVDVVNELVSSRLFQFENTCVVELPLFLDEHAIDPATRLAVLRYSRAIQDWIAGDFEWETRPGGRYMPGEPERVDGMPAGPTGLGTRQLVLSLRRALPGLRRFQSHAHIPFAHVERGAMPDLYMPYRARISPHVEEVRGLLRRWFREMGITEPYPGGPSVVWDEAMLNAVDSGGCASRVVPSGSLRELEINALWYAWVTWADDYYMIYLARDRNAAAVQSRRLPLFMPLPGVSAPPPANVVERSLADLWARTVQVLPRAVHGSLRQHAAAMFSAWVWESQNLTQHRIPDLIDYVEMRRGIFSAEILLDLLRVKISGDVPPAVMNSQMMGSLEHAVMDYLCFTNDIFSYLKEIECDGDFHNLVRITETAMGLGYPDALALVCRLMDGRLRQFEAVVTKELPAFVTMHRLDDQSQAALAVYVSQIQDCLAGILDWHRVSGRYEPGEVRKNCASVHAARKHTGMDRWALRAHGSSRHLRAPEPPPAAPSPRIASRFPAIPALYLDGMAASPIAIASTAPSDAPKLPTLIGLGTSAARLFAGSTQQQTSRDTDPKDHSEQ
jgi:germacradienol/geosmin synthase